MVVDFSVGAEGTPLASTFVKIAPDTSGFPEELRAKVAAATEVVGGKVKITGDMSGLAADIDRLKAKALELRLELARDPGNSGLKRHLSDINIELRGLESNRKAIDSMVQDLAKVPDNLGFNKPTLFGGVVAGLVAATPLITSALGGALLAGVAAAGIGSGVAAAIKSPAVQAAGKDLGHDLQAELSRAAKPMADAIVAEAPRIGEAFHAKIAPQLAAIWSSLAPDVDVLSQGALSGISNAMPGIESMVQASQPLIQMISQGFARAGTDATEFMDKIAAGAPGGIAALRDLGHAVEDIVSVTGTVIEDGEKLYSFLSGLGLPVKNVAEDVVLLVAAYKAATLAQAAWGTIRTVFTAGMTAATAATQAQALTAAQATESTAALGAAQAALAMQAARAAAAEGTFAEAVDALTPAAYAAATANEQLAVSQAATAEAGAAAAGAQSRWSGGLAKGTAVAAAAVIGIQAVAAAWRAFVDQPKGVDSGQLTGILDQIGQGKAGFKSLSGLTSNFDDDLGTLANNAGANFGHRVSSFVEGITGTGDIEGTFTKARTNVSQVDQALASMVQNGQGQQAAAVFAQIQQHAKDAGLSVGELTAGFPAYEAAVNGASGATTGAAAAMSTAGKAASSFSDDAKTITDDLSNLTAHGQAAAAVLKAFWASHADLNEASIKSQAAVSAGLGDMRQHFADADYALAQARQSQTDTYISSQESLSAAVRAVSSAQLQRTDAERQVAEATKNAQRALQDYQNQLRDIPDQEEEASIRVARAQAQVTLSAGLPGSNLDRREALLQLSEAQHAQADTALGASRTRQDAATAEAKGVSGADQVVAARRQVTAAIQGEQGARQSLSDTQRRNAESATSAAKAVADARTNDSRSMDVNTTAGAKNVGMVLQQIDVLKQQYADNIAKANGDKTLEAQAEAQFQAGMQRLEDQAGQYGLNKQAVDNLAQSTSDYQAMSPVDMMFNLIGAPDAQTKIQQLFNQVKDFASLFGVTLSALNEAGAPDRPGGSTYNQQVPYAARHAGGGPVVGPGTGMSDDVLMWGSNDEHMWTAAEVQAVGGHGNVKALRNMALGRYATGGPVMPTLGIREDIGAEVNRVTAPAFTAVANAIADASAAGAGGYTGPAGAGFSIQEILRTAALSGIPHVDTSDYRPGANDYHGQGEAVDFGNYLYGQAADDALAAWFMANFSHKLLELIHTRADGQSGWYVKNGQVVPQSFYGPSLARQHIDHVHVAARPGFSAGGGSNAVGTGIAGGGTSGAGLFSAIINKVMATGSLTGNTGDANVAALAYQTARGMGADRKVLLSLFEAGLVESNMHNLPYGDRDSLGFLQQRPSQGWPSPMNVPVATRSFVSRAMANEGRYATPGGLAQSVQVSAFPDRYNARMGDAAALLTRVSGGVYDQGGSLPPGYAAVNLGHRPEQVLTPDESAGLKAAVQPGPLELSDRTIRQLGMVLLAAVNGRDQVVQVDSREVARAVADHQAREMVGVSPLGF